MLEYSVSDVKIKINANNKIYVLGVDSAEGKSYLYTLLKSLQQRPEYKDKLLLVTYSDDMDIQRIISKIEGFRGDLVMMDRLDIYWCEELRSAIKQKHECPILLDLKSNDYINKLPAIPIKFIWDGNTMGVEKYAVDV